MNGVWVRGIASIYIRMFRERVCSKEEYTGGILSSSREEAMHCQVPKRKYAIELARMCGNSHTDITESLALSLRSFNSPYSRSHD